MFNLPYLDGELRESASTKCNTCKEITEQEFIKVVPNSPDVDPMELLKLSKRLVCCTKCGTLRLIN